MDCNLSMRYKSTINHLLLEMTVHLHLPFALRKWVFTNMAGQSCSTGWDEGR